MLRVVILGTGTGVGKTRVSTLLATALHEARTGLAVAALKPVETGIHRRRGRRPPHGSDAEALEAVSSARASSHPLYAYSQPLSVHLASRSRDPVSIKQIRRWLSTIHYDICIVETAGGALSPLSRNKVNFDLAASLEPAVWVVVAPDTLGVLHDVGATWMAARAGWRAPDYLVLSASRPPDASTGTNARELPRVGLPRPIAVIPPGCRSTQPLMALARALLRLNQAASRSAPRDPGPRAHAARPHAPRSRQGGSRSR